MMSSSEQCRGIDLADIRIDDLDWASMLADALIIAERMNQHEGESSRTPASAIAKTAAKGAGI